MNICFDGLKSGPICIGDTFGRLHGEAFTAGHVGFGMLGLILVAILIFVFRQPT